VTSKKLSAPARGNGPSRGDRFLTAVQARFEPGIVEAELLTEVCRLLDLQDSLWAAIQRDGPMVIGSTGQPRSHPAVAERRGNALALGRLLPQLGIDEDGEAVPSPQSVRGKRAATARWSQPPTGSPTSDAASRAALVRWHGRKAADA
jgi:hypothetical protein